MSRRFRLLVLAVLVLVVAGVAFAVVRVRPDLGNARDHVDARWTPLRASLVKRYEALGAVSQALKNAGAGDRSVTKDLDIVLAQWKKLSLLGAHHSDLNAEAVTANELEALARRVSANVAASARLQADPAVQAALVAFGAALPPPPRVKAYNRAVHAYEQQRSGTVHRLVADVLGYEARPELLLGT